MPTRARPRPASATPPTWRMESVGATAGAAAARNRLYHGDNLACLAHLAADRWRPDLIYIDPPFGTQQHFTLGAGGPADSPAAKSSR
ncbi:MAG: hypothetical protein ACREJ2_00125, partial [Planctomycetota bacterium]